MAPCRIKSYMIWTPRLLSTPTGRLAPTFRPWQHCEGHHFRKRKVDEERDQWRGEGWF